MSSAVPTLQTSSARSRWQLAGALAASVLLLQGCADHPQCLSPPEVGPGVEDSEAPVSSAPLVDSVLRLLTNDQYDNTVADLLGTEQAPGRDFPPVAHANGFGRIEGVDALRAEHLVAAAEKLAVEAVAQLDGLDGCAGDEEACVDDFLADFLRRAFRRPVEADEIARYTGFFTQSRATQTFEDSLALLIEAVLLSPSFVYLREGADLAGEDHSADVKLSQIELASRLSYAIWNSSPDAELVAAAEAGELEAPAQLEAQARRLLADPRARGAVASFFRQWLGLQRLDTLIRREARIWDPLVHESSHEVDDPLLGRSQRIETETFATHVFFNESGSLEELLTASYLFSDSRSAAIYAGPEVFPGEGFVRVELDPNERAGLLTQASLMVLGASNARTSPTLRGKFVRERFLCQPISAPPNNTNTEISTRGEQVTTRAAVEEHVTNPACAACHVMMDPIGLGFEAYDKYGRYVPDADATGELHLTTDANGPFSGPIELAQRLAGSEQVRQCLGRQWLRFQLRRTERPEDEAALVQADQAFAMAGNDMRELVIGLVLSDSFAVHRSQVMPTP